MSTGCNSQQRLVAIAPEKVLGANILVRILGPLFQRRHMLPVLPMLVPQIVGVEAGDGEGGDDDAGGRELVLGIVYLGLSKQSRLELGTGITY
jgi:hypothetical protein